VIREVFRHFVLAVGVVVDGAADQLIEVVIGILDPRSRDLIAIEDVGLDFERR
jgi:hypothetical protein